MDFTTNFSLEQLTKSNTATAKGYDEQFKPPLDIQSNLRLLAIQILQPLRDAYNKPIIVNCAYRCQRLNDAVKGVQNSQHLQGKSADITGGNKTENKILFDLIRSLDLPFDQLICEGGKDANGESNYSWIHVSYDATRNRKQVLSL